MKMRDKERLENISPKGFDLNGNILLNSDDYHWLMERAERVEELERDLNEWRNEALRLFELLEEYQEIHLKAKYVEELERDLNEWRSEAIRWLKLFEEYQELNKRLREALEFYASGNHYSDRLYDDKIVLLDNGEKARQALEGDK